jgi:trehalose 6-phosphate synthase/phosphatase
MQTLINVSNRLPVTVGETIEKSSGGLVSSLEGVENDFDFKWIGWSGGIVQKPADRERIKSQLVEQYNYFPVFLSRREKEGYYDGFSNTTLWPLLHYQPQFTEYDQGWFDQYLAVNRKFAQTVSRSAEPGGLVWIHDYHLMLMPGLLRELRPDLRIGFFLHTPFPSYEIFRCHPNREELLQGLLGADLIGFQTFGYLRHFRSTILRLLGIESDISQIAVDNHITRIGVYPIGINSEKFQRELQSDEFADRLDEFQKAYQGKTVVLSVERLDYTKGVPHKLNAIEKFLEMNDEAVRDAIVFIFIAVPSRTGVKEYNRLVQEVERRTSQINGKYATLTNIPVHFINKSVDSFSELCALYSLADVALVTPLIDGMNLVAKEYIACQQQKNGVLILSEFAGAAQELPHALVVNPYNRHEVTQAMQRALSLTDGEKEKLIQPMKERVLKYDARHWANSFVAELAAKASPETLPIETTALTLDAVKPLEGGRKTALFLDYDGTLADIKKTPADATPDKPIQKLFALMQQVGHMDIYLISGRKRDDMDQWFSDYGFHLIAEHGYYHKLHGTHEWALFDPQADLSWKSQILDVLQLYTGMTPGSVLEEKTSSVVWHYRNADPEFGAWKANQLVSELSAMLTNVPVEMHHGKKIVEISSIQVNKGIVLEHFVHQKRYDAVLCAGDDETDESMFRISDGRLISVKVGPGVETAAQYRIAGPGLFREFLTDLLTSRINER